MHGPAFVFALAALLSAPCFGGGVREERLTGQPPEETQSDVLVFTGVAGRLTSRDASIKAALRDAARRVAFFQSVGVSSIKRERIGSSIFDYLVESEYELVYDEDIERFIEQFEFDPHTDVFEHSNTVFVTVHWPGNVVMPAFRGHGVQRERPAWIDAPPAEVGGYTAGVGYAGRHTSHKDTVIASYEDAAVQIAESLEVSVKGFLESYENSYSTFGFNLTSQHEIATWVLLRNFYVIESWTDPATLGVWTLAVARKE